MADDDSTEIEWQFDALDLRPVERWLAALPSHDFGLPTLTVLAKQTRRLVDHYVDTEDWRIAQAGFVLRTRQRGHSTESTMKDMRPATPSGLRRRLEVTQSGALSTDGPVGRRLLAVAGRRPLIEIFEVRTRRVPYSLRSEGIEVAEVALDETTIVVAPKQPPARLQRVEVEVTADWADRLAPVVDHLRSSCELRPASLSKFEAGLLAAGISVPGPPDLGSTDISPDISVGELASAVLRRQLYELLTHESGTRLGEDIEDLHDMRVATRRLRAIIELFGTVLPVRARTLHRELGWLAGVLGAVRDLDVQLAHTEIPALKALLEAERDDARKALLQSLDSTRWKRLASGLVALARHRPLAAASMPAANALPALVRERHHAVMQAARRARQTGLPTDYHRLRIRCKRLRYALEFSIYGTDASSFVKRLTSVQEALGEMQDAQVAATRLATLATTEALPTQTVFLMGGIAERYRRESEELLRAAAKHLDGLNAKEWKHLDAIMLDSAEDKHWLQSTRTPS